MAGKVKPLEQRFWEKVDTGPGCWLWTGAKYFNGYGYIWVTGKKQEYAHRVAYRLTHGDMPAGLFV